MSVSDSKPQSRRQVNRIERLAGLFICVGLVLVLAGLWAYTRHAAREKGWFVNKVSYFIYVRTAAGLKVGDPVRLMGFEVGRIIDINPMPPGPFFNEHGFDVYIEFEVRAPHYGYVWTDSRVRVGAADLLGNRFLELSKGGTTGATEVHATYREEKNIVNGVWDDKAGVYQPLQKNSKPYWLLSDEAPALTDRVQDLVAQVEQALPGFVGLTNRIELVLSSANTLALHADEALASLRPALSNLTPVAANLAVITTHLRAPQGSLGDWLVPTNLNAQIATSLRSADLTLNTVTTNLNGLTLELGETLVHLANLTSNLNAQVQANTNILSDLSRAVVHTDELVQGLKTHWFLRSAFKEKKTNAPPRAPPEGKGATRLLRR